MPTLAAPQTATYSTTVPSEFVTVICSGASDAMLVSWAGPAGTSGQRTVRNTTTAGEDIGPLPNGTTVTFTALSGSPIYLGYGESLTPLVSGAGTAGAIAVMGDSIAAWNYTGSQYWNSRGSLNWALARAGQTYDLQPADFFAVSGVTSAHLLATQLPLVQAAVAAGRRYRKAWISMGVNDAGNGLTYDQTVANITAVCTALNAMGIQPLIRAISARGSDASLTAAKSQYLRTNAWLRRASLDGLLKLIDNGDVFTDNSTAFFNAVSGTVDGTDLLHPLQRGAVMEGELLYQQVFAKEGLPPMAFATSTADLFDRVLNPGGCLASQPFQTSGASVSNSSAVAPWFSAGTWTVQARTLPNGQTRNDPLLTVAAAGGNATLLADVSSGGAWSGNSQPAAGGVYEARARVRITGAVKVNELSLTLQENNGSGALLVGALAREGTDTSQLVLPDGDYWLRTPRITVRPYSGSGACVLRASLNVNAAAGGGAAGTAQVLGLEIRPVSLGS